MAEEALARIAEACKWECYRSSRALIFPGGAIAHFEEFLTHVRMFWPFLSEAQARRMARAYGVMLHEMLGQVRNEAEMGRSFGAGFTGRSEERSVGREGVGKWRIRGGPSI